LRISVCIVTYNHAQYIDACVRSAATQDFDGSLEIVVSDDASADATPEILMALQQEFPDRVRVILQQRNLGAAQNFSATIKACRGEYVAFLEGDNFWTDPEKLRLQAAMLDAHPDMAFCFHRTRSLHEALPPDGTEHDLPEQDFPLISGIDCLLGPSNPVALGSMLVRRALLADLDIWTEGLKLGDWPLCMMLARHGTIGYLPREMSRQRMHDGGAWTVLSPTMRGLYILQMLRRVSVLLDGAARDKAQAQFDKTLDWLAGALCDSLEDSRDSVRTALSRMQEPDLSSGLLWAVIRQEQRRQALLEARQQWTEGQLEAHRAASAEEIAWLRSEREALIGAVAELQATLGRMNPPSDGRKGRAVLARPLSLLQALFKR
jgi:glycosyltransferase involved in cell wall biosynthesis